MQVAHYGWPQSLEAYHQESGRAGRDGVPAICVLFVPALTVPTLLPGKRTAEQTRGLKAMLDVVHDYAMDGRGCRRAALLRYFGERLPCASPATSGGGTGGAADRGRGVARCCDVCDGAAHLPSARQPLLAETVRLLEAWQSAADVQTGLPATKHSLGPLEADGVCAAAAGGRIPPRSQLQWRWWRGMVRLLAKEGLMVTGLRPKQRLHRPAAGAGGGGRRRRKKRRRRGATAATDETTADSAEYECKEEDDAPGGRQSSSGDERVYWLSARGRALLSAGPAAVCTLRLWPELDMHVAAAAVSSTAASTARRAWGKGWADPAERRRRLQSRAV